MNTSEFNALPVDDILFEPLDAANATTGLVTRIPIHRHTTIGEDQRIVWSLGPAGLAAQVSKASLDQLIPCFWTTSPSGELMAYEYVDTETAKVLEMVNYDDHLDAISACLETDGRSYGYKCGAQTLCGAYTRYLTGLSNNLTYIACLQDLVQFLMAETQFGQTGLSLDEDVIKDRARDTPFSLMEVDHPQLGVVIVPTFTDHLIEHSSRNKITILSLSEESIYHCSNWKIILL